MNITVCQSLGPRQWQSCDITLADGATVEQALDAWRAAQPEPNASEPNLHISIWGEAVKPSRVLRDGERIELTRALRVDPKTARRERFAQQGVRASGLFANRRPGGKPGY
jgi:uncharacterized protein